VDVIVDDTPAWFIVSAFDNVRRETARLSLQKLIQDGRNSSVAHRGGGDRRTQAEMDKHIMEVGKESGAGGHIGTLHDKLMQ